MIPLIQILLAFIIGFTLVYLTIPVIVKLSVAKKLVDTPNERKVNKVAIPNLGGIAIFIGVTLGTLLAIQKNIFVELRYVLAGMIIMLFVGIKDDILALSASKKFVSQIICALIIIALGDIRFTNLHGLFGIYEIGYVSSVLITMLAIVSIINALNLIDGIDGLATAIGILASLSFGTMFFALNHFNYATLSFSLAGSLASFFFFNVFGRKNKIFMGDTGSLSLGLLLAIFTIKFNEFTITENQEFFSFAPILSLAVISVPLLDMIRLFITRIINNRSPFSPDINHIHHKVLKLGYSHLKATIIISTVNLFLISIVSVSRNLNNNVLLLLLIFLGIFFSLIPGLFYEIKKANNSTIRKMQLHLFFLPFKKFSEDDKVGNNSLTTKN